MGQSSSSSLATTSQSLAPESEQWSTSDAVAHGWAYSTVMRYITGGLLLSAKKVGRRWRFDRAELESLGRRVDRMDIAPDTGALSDPVREWARAQAASAPPKSASEARVVGAIFRRAARDRQAGAA